METSYPCKKCRREFRSRHAMLIHYGKAHSNRQATPPPEKPSDKPPQPPLKTYRLVDELPVKKVVVDLYGENLLNAEKLNVGDVIVIESASSKSSTARSVHMRRMCRSRL